VRLERGAGQKAPPIATTPLMVTNGEARRTRTTCYTPIVSTPSSLAATHALAELLGKRDNDRTSLCAGSA